MHLLLKGADPRLLLDHNATTEDMQNKYKCIIVSKRTIGAMQCNDRNKIAMKRGEC